jgi:protein O-GlcNAc transferase
MAEPRLESLLEEIRANLLSGDAQAAFRIAHAAAGTFDFDARAHYALASVLIALGEAELAATSLSTAQNTHCLQMLIAGGTDVARMQTDAAYAMAEGRRYYNADLLGAASTACAFASRDPAVAAGVSGGLHVWGQALFHQGAARIEQALRTFIGAFNASPSPMLYSFVLYAMFFVENGRERHAAEARGWAKAFADSFTPVTPAFQVERRADRPLRVGYMAPSFTGNQLSPFALPLIDGHDPAHVEAFVYVDDATREQFADHVTVRSVKPLTYDLHARQIMSDRIDVLVDVWGHAAGGRLQVFARKPAPVQLSWLNYIQTTGVAAMDYVIHSDFMDAPGREALFTEQIANVGPVLAPFRPPTAAAPSPAPVLTRGYTTFASFNHPAKVSDQSLRAWCAILKATPGSRLLFKYRYFVDPVVQDTLRARMLGYGADPLALDFEGFSKGDDYEAAFARVDLMLDTAPVNGGTTTMEAFSRGVPVLTVDGRSDFYARMGVQPLMALGMPEMIADDWDSYVATAVALAADPAALAALRSRVRPALDASAYRDEAGFTARMEGLYRQMFETWLAKPQQAAA